MKKYSIFILASSALAFAACADLNEPNVDPLDGNRITIEASIDAQDLRTKTSMGNPTDSVATYPVLWSAGDKIALLSELGVSKFTIMDYEGPGVDPNYPQGSGPGTTTAKFYGNATQVVDAFPNTNVYAAAYPADGAFAETEGGTMWIGSEIPMVQLYNYNEDSATNEYKGFADNTFPMASGGIDPAHYVFYNMAGIIRLKVWSSEGGRITRITLKNNAHSPLTGPVAMEFSSENGGPVASTVGKDNGKVVKAWGTEGSENAIIDLSDIVEDSSKPNVTGVTIPTSESDALIFDIAVIPQDFPKGFTVQLQDATNMGNAEWISNPVCVKRSQMLEMSAMNYVQPEALGIANCYQLSEAGEYLLPSYAYGNRLDIMIGNADEGFNPDNLDIALYWTDITDDAGNKKDFMTNLRYIKFANGINYMSFKLLKDPSSQTTLPDGSLDPDSGHCYRGNVVLALYNVDTKKIFWSWHMWLTDYTPRDVLIDGACAAGSYTGTYPDGTLLNYEADATKGRMLIMDRNLGAVYATPAEALAAGEPVWKTYGLYYQDGRKDPFIGGSGNGGPNSAKTNVKCQNKEMLSSLHVFEDTAFGSFTDKTWTNPMFTSGGVREYPMEYRQKVMGAPKYVSADKSWIRISQNMTLTESIRDPQIYAFDNSGTFQWTNCDFDDNMSWMSGGAHGKTGLTKGGHEAYWNRTKTIMDPCPPGYSVLGERGGYFFGGNGTKNWYADDTNGYGLMYTSNVTAQHGETTTTWWPAAGVRTWDGRMAGVGEYGAYFFYDHIEATHGGHGLVFHVNNGGGGGFDTESNKDAVITNHATSIRCVRDKQGDYANNGKTKSNRIVPVN